MTGLETRYRRMLMVLPAAYRRQRAEEMLSALLDGAAPGQTWPRIGEAASLGVLAARLRLGAPGATGRDAVYGQVLRRVALLGLLVQALLYWTYAARAAVGWIWPSSGPDLPERLDQRVQLLVMEFVQPLALVLCFLALVLGRRRIGRALSLLTMVIAIDTYAVTLGYDVAPEALGLLVMSLLCTAAVQLGFHRDAPSPDAPERWLIVGIVSCVLVLAVASTATYLGIHDAVYSNVFTANFAYNLLVSPLGPVLAIGFAAARARRSAVWPASLLIVGLPALLVVPSTIALIGQDQMGDFFPGGPYLAQSLASLGIEALVTETCLAVILVWSLRRHGPRRGLATARPSNLG
jgi:hypothetical protein